MKLEMFSEYLLDALGDCSVEFLAGAGFPHQPVRCRAATACAVGDEATGRESVGTQFPSQGMEIGQDGCRGLEFQFSSHVVFHRGDALAVVQVDREVFVPQVSREMDDAVEIVLPLGAGAHRQAGEGEE